MHMLALFMSFAHFLFIVFLSIIFISICILGKGIRIKRKRYYFDTSLPAGDLKDQNLDCNLDEKPTI